MIGQTKQTSVAVTNSPTKVETQIRALVTLHIISSTNQNLTDIIIGRKRLNITLSIRSQKNKYIGSLSQKTLPRSYLKRHKSEPCHLDMCYDSKVHSRCQGNPQVRTRHTRPIEGLAPSQQSFITQDMKSSFEI